MNYTYRVGGRAWASLLEFTVPESGRYRLVAWLPGGSSEPVVLAVGRVGDLLFGTFRSTAVFLGSTMLAVGIAAVTYWKRKKVMQRRATTPIATARPA